MNKTDNNFVIHLQNTIHEKLSPLVPKSGKFALLDFPDHSNVGDSAIWLGEIKYFFKWHKLQPAYVCTIHNYSKEALKKALPEGPIFLHGGGNFGDIWLWHQEFREKVMRDFPDRKIVQLPQSLHFSSEELLRKATAAIGAHPDFTLLVRDYKSMAIAEKHFSCPIKLCPDMAFCLGVLEKVNTPLFELLLLMRTDKERSDMQKQDVKLPDNALKMDWLDEDANLHRKLRRLTAMQLLYVLKLKAFDKNRRRELFYHHLATARIKRGIKLLSSAKYVITDRLHVHILCALLGQPHTVLDNNYGKNSGFIGAWTNKLNNTSFAPSLTIALEAHK